MSDAPPGTTGPGPGPTDSGGTTDRSASPERGVILLVEDDDGLRPIVSRHLRHHGFSVTEAASAEEASSALAAGLRPALVLLDVNLPGDNGWDLVRSPAMRRAGPPPVVIASAVTVSPRRLAEFGIAGYLPKPFPLETLLQIVERLMAPQPDPDAAGGTGVHTSTEE